MNKVSCQLHWHLLQSYLNEVRSLFAEKEQDSEMIKCASVTFFVLCFKCWQVSRLVGMNSIAENH